MYKWTLHTTKYIGQLLAPTPYPPFIGAGANGTLTFQISMIGKCEPDIECDTQTLSFKCKLARSEIAFA